MWSILLAAFADERSSRERKAGLHELRQRLGVAKTVDRRPPPFTQQLLDWEDRVVPVVLPHGFSLVETLENIASFFTDREEGGNSFRRPASSVKKSDRMSDFMYEILNPGEEKMEGQAAYDRAVARRTPRDGLLAWVLEQWNKAGLDYDFYMEVELHLPSMMDWAEAAHVDLTKLSWEDAVLGAQAWHQQFAIVDFGDVPRPGLVVLRWSDGWTLHRILERQGFADEGSAMGHCIGGPVRGTGRPDGDSRYWRKTRDDVGAAFSLRNPEGRAEATVSVVQNGRGVFLIDDIEAVNNERLSTGLRLRLLSAYPAIGMTAERTSMTGLAMDRGALPRAIRPPEAGVDPETDSDYTGKPWVSLGAKTWREATTEIAKESGLLLLLEAVRTFAQKMDEPITAVGLRGVDIGFPYVHLVPTGPEPHPGWVRVRPHPTEDRGLIEVVFPSGVNPVVEYPTLYAAYLAASGRPKVRPYAGFLYPDVTPEQRKALTESLDISGGAAPGMGRRSSLLAALGRSEPTKGVGLRLGSPAWMVKLVAEGFTPIAQGEHGLYSASRGGMQVTDADAEPGFLFVGDDIHGWASIPEATLSDWIRRQAAFAGR